MPLLKESDREQIRQEFKQLQSPVKLVFFTQSLDCDYCALDQQILEELSGLDDKIQLQIFNFAIDKEQVFNYKIARIPAVAVVRVETQAKDGVEETFDRDYGIRYYGLPAGFEFASLIGDVIDVSRGESGLSAQSKQEIATLQDPLHLQVFVTPT